MAIAIGQFTIINMNDIPASALPPNNPSVNQLWMDITSVPNLLKKWDGSVWVRTGASNLAELDPAAKAKADDAYVKADAAGYDALNASSSAATALDMLRTKYTDNDLLSEMLGVINGDVARYSIANWCKDNNLTVIDGSKIAADSIEVGSLNAANLSAISSDLGIVTTGVIRSADYDAGSGIELDFRDTTEDGFSVKSSTKNTTLKIDADGTRVYNNSDLTTPVAQFVDSGVEAKKVTAEMGVIAGLQITTVNGEVWLSSIL